LFAVICGFLPDAKTPGRKEEGKKKIGRVKFAGGKRIFRVVAKGNRALLHWGLR